MFTNEVFDRTDAGSSAIISERTYNLIIGLTLLWGFAANWFIVTNVSTEAILAIGSGTFLIGYFISCIIGSMMFNASSNPFVSFLGYNFVVVPFGLVLNVFLQDVSPDLIVQALEITGLVTGIMMMLGTLYPAFFAGIYRGLFIALLAAIVVELGMIFILGHSFAFMDFIVAVIFCGYIGFDWSRAQAIPKTVDNAVDSAAALYMSIVNLFVRVVSLLKN